MLCRTGRDRPSVARAHGTSRGPALRDRSSINLSCTGISVSALIEDAPESVTSPREQRAYAGRCIPDQPRDLVMSKTLHVSQPKAPFAHSGPATGKPDVHPDPRWAIRHPHELRAFPRTAPTSAQYAGLASIGCHFIQVILPLDGIHLFRQVGPEYTKICFLH